MMLEELSHMFPDETDDPTALLMMAGLVREDLPWLSELLVETYRELRAGDDKTARRALQRLSRLTRGLGRSPFMEEMVLNSKEAHMLAMEFPHSIERWLHRYDTARGPAAIDGSDKPSELED